MVSRSRLRTTVSMRILRRTGTRLHESGGTRATRPKCNARVAKVRSSEHTPCLVAVRHTVSRARHFQHSSTAACIVEASLSSETLCPRLLAYPIQIFSNMCNYKAIPDPVRPIQIIVFEHIKLRVLFLFRPFPRFLANGLLHGRPLQ